MNLKVNVKKTKYLGNREVQKLEEIGIQKVETFRYLGTWLSIRGGLKEQLNRTKKIVTMKAQKLSMLRRLIPFRSLAKLWVLYVLVTIEVNGFKMATHQRNSFRRILGLNKSFPRSIIDGIISRLEYDAKENGYIRKQLKISLFREKFFNQSPEGFIWRDTIQLYNFFLWNQFQEVEMSKFGLEESNLDQYASLANIFCQDNNGYMEQLQSLKQKFNEWDYFEKNPLWSDGCDVPRGVQTQVIRRIPGYQFFEPFKHGWRQCITHRKGMTAKHMLEDHLFGEPGNWLEKLEKIQQHILDTAKPFYTSVQKSMHEMADKLAERIRKLVKVECEPFKRKRKIQ